MPGKLFEYPALRFAQWLCCENKCEDVLYVHTKGAGRPSDVQKKIRKMWEMQFTEVQGEKYRVMLGEFDVICPLSGRYGETWFNGMLISKRAFENIGTIRPEKDRYVYQRLFLGQKVRGMLRESIEASELEPYMMTHTFDRNGVKAIRDYSMALEFVRKK